MKTIKIALLFSSFFLFVSFNQMRAQQLSAYIEITGAKTEFCTNQTFALAGIANDGTGTYIEHHWIDNSGIIYKTENNVAIIKAKEAGTYTITYQVKDDAGNFASTNISFKINQSPSAEIVDEEGRIKLINLTGENPFKFSWYENNKKIELDNVSYSKNTTYRVVIVDKNGCSFSTSKVF